MTTILKGKIRFMNSTHDRVIEHDALGLLHDAPLLELGQRAFMAKRARYGDRITYVINRHVNPTNLCVYACAFCDFAAKKGDRHAYVLDEEAILRDLVDPALAEVHIVGGLWPVWGMTRSLALVHRIRDMRPDLWIKAFTAVEVAYFARSERIATEDVLQRMIDAGVDAMPGGGAEILTGRIHAALYPQKIGPDEWLAIHRLAHRLGLPTNATMLFGHIETDDAIIEHLLRLRELQDETGGFQSFIPLAYQPGETQLVSRMVSSPRCLRIVALSRLVLDNVAHIKAYWPTLQVETASAALSFGADDLDGSLGKERIMQLAQSAAPAQLSTVFMEKMIRHAGQLPARRDGRFGILDDAVHSCEAAS